MIKDEMPYPQKIQQMGITRAILRNSEKAKLRQWATKFASLYWYRANGSFAPAVLDANQSEYVAEQAAIALMDVSLAYGLKNPKWLAAAAYAEQFIIDSGWGY